MNNSRPDFDVGIIGGGPAGASMACYLAQKGISCVVFERDLFPRPHVGESLVPASTRIFKEIGFLEKLEQSTFLKKYGAVWTTPGTNKIFHHDWDGFETATQAGISFSEREQAGVDLPYTYHVDRGRFDLLLLQHANELGATVYEGVNVRTADFSDPELTKILFSMGKQEYHVTVRMVVDASGRRTLMGTQMGWKVLDPVFDQYALHTWFEGFDRTSGSQEEATLTPALYTYIHFLPITNSWVWQIPITDTITSVGVVTHKKNFPKAKQMREQFFWESVSSRPTLFEGLQKSKQVRPFTEEGDYTYGMKQIIGDRLVLIGDAARFVDPIFSNGVSVALNSSRFASADIIRAVETGDFSRKSFEGYEKIIRRGMKNWYEFVTCYYRLNVMFTYFLMNPKYRLDVLKLLQGDVYDEDSPPAIEKMKSVIVRVERDKTHRWHDYLGEITGNAFRAAF